MPVTQCNFAGPLAFPGYVLSPSGGLVRYAHNLGAAGLDQLPVGIADIMDTTLDAAMSKCRANRGDTIILPAGYAENVAIAAALPNCKAGVRVIGDGNLDDRPTFTWTAAASQWAISVANVKFENIIFNFAGTAATTVTKAIAASGAGLWFKNCSFIFGASATQKAAIGIEYVTGADKCRVEDCEIFSTADAAVTDHFLVTNAVDRFKFRRNYGSGGPSGANGLLRFAAAATNILVDENALENTLAGANSTAVFVGFAGLTGQFPWNSLSVQNNGTASAQGIIVPGNTRGNQTYTSDEAGKSGMLSPGVAT